MVSELEEKGLPRRRVWEQLEERLRGDLTYTSGRILGSMCTQPHPFAVQVYRRYLEKNLGDPGLFPVTQELEREAVGMLGALLSNPNASGHIVTGGTEANLLAMWAARNLRGSGGGEVVAPRSVHRSLDKAANLLGFKLIRVSLNEKFQVDVNALRRAITPRTFALVGVAGTTELGAVDPIAELSEIAESRGLYLHVDAAFGGLVLPFLRDLGYSDITFDFSLPGVSSVTVDPHKMGMCPIPAGGILFRDERIPQAISVDIPYLAGGNTVHETLVGTRSGASALAVWAMLKHLGRAGYRAIVKRCMELTHRLAEGIAAIEGVQLVMDPVMNIVGITSNQIDIGLLERRLREKKWAVARFSHHLRIVVMPHVKAVHIESFLEDLKCTVQKLR